MLFRSAGNLIGTDVTGTFAVGNRNYGVGMLDKVTNNVIGGSAPDDRNVISGNGNGLIFADAGTRSNVVLGNYIGTDISGMKSLANNIGVWICNKTTENQLGGADGTDPNTISGNTTYGVVVVDAETKNNRIQGNYIGVGRDGVTSLGNGWSGVAFWGGSTANLLGGKDSSAGNIIANNGDNGIAVFGDTAGNKIGRAHV